ncbi:MAG: hypothetical protein NTY66_02690 [Candidatus Vogelbacteria bacterium]|nr:hypothetical protein [Candidatus Vogelbacteria bacterium]
MTLKRDWPALEFLGGDKAKDVVIPAGRHEVERITNPLGYLDAPWLVLKGTMIGASEGSWRQWKNGVLNRDDQSIDWGKWEVVIED